jgi:sigma-E factor negative regulatory protein RseC
MSSIREEGVVTEIRGREARVQIPRGGSCAGCGGCAAGADFGHMIATVQTVKNLQVGDRVALQGRGPSSITGGLTLFILPLTLFVIGFAAGETIAPGLRGLELDSQALGGVLGALLAVLPYLYLFLRRHLARRRGVYELRIAEILGHKQKDTTGSPASFA